MSFLSTLTNIGLTLGKVAMSIFGGNTIALKDNEEYILGSRRIVDIAFVSKKKNGRQDIYICNTSPTRKYVVTFPDENGGDGEILYLKDLEEHPITDWFNGNHSPHRQIYISLEKDSADNSSPLAASSLPMLNLSFNRLELNGKPVQLGGFKISALEQSGIKGINIECQHAMGLQKLNSCTLTNDKGICMYLSNPISPDKNDEEEKQFYPLDYTLHGLKNGDYVSGIVNVEVKDSNVLTANCFQSRKILPMDVLTTLRNV